MNTDIKGVGMVAESIRVIGRVLASKGHLVGMLVQVTAVGREQEPVISGLTDAAGAFSLRCRRHPGARDGLMRARVFRGGECVLERLIPLSRFGKIELSVNVDDQGSDVSKRTIDGHVIDAHVGRRAGLVVRAFFKRVRSESCLGEATTDEDGRFHIAYGSLPVTGAADVFIRVFDVTGAVLATTPVQYQVPTAALIDITINGDHYVGPSDYERAARALSDSLEGADPATLTDSEVAFLSESTNTSADELKRFLVATRVAGETNIPVPILFALFAASSESDPTLVLARPTSVQRASLERAIAANQIPFSFGLNLESTLEQLEEGAARLALTKSSTNTASLGDVLDVTAVPPLAKDVIARAFVGHDDSPATAWNKIRKAGNIDPATIEGAQRALQLSVLTRGHLPMMQALEALHRDGSIRTLRDFANLSSDDWRKLATQTGAPADSDGGTNEDRIAGYADALQQSVEEAFPTSAIVAQLTRSSTNEVSNDAITFLKNNPDLELRTTPIDGYLAKCGDAAWANISDRESALRSVRAVQRVLKLTSHADAGLALLSRGITSARSIVAMGRDAFASALVNTTTATYVDALYTRASQVSASTLAILSKYAPSLDSIEMRVLPGVPRDEIAKALSAAGLPNYESLFGSIDYCKCEDCRSLTSPAAYFVDLLAFLDDAARRVLFDRRADLQDIDLTCANTNVPLPYIDLVNEILENAISPTSSVPQTTWRAEELAVSPEHVNTSVYETVLVTAVYPWSLPFDLATEEARVYLGQRNLHRDALMTTFRKAAVPSAPVSDFMIAADAIGLSWGAARIIVGSDPSSAWRDWGYSAKPAGWDWPMSDVPVRDFLARSSLTYDELRSVLKTQFVNPHTPSPQVTIEFHHDECNLDHAAVVHLTSSVLDRMHRFARLRRVLGWTDHELDWAISTFHSADIDSDFVVDIAAVQGLKTTLHLSVAELLAWWGPMDRTQGDDDAPSFYDEVYRNRAVLADAELAAFDLPSSDTGDETPPGTTNLSLHSASIQAALSVGADDYALLTDDAVAQSALSVRAEVKSDKLNLANLSRLYRIVSLAKAVRAPVSDVVSFRALSGIDPFDRAHPLQAQRFVDEFRLVHTAGWRVDELDALLRGVERESVRGALSPAASLRIVVDLYTGLAKIAADNAVVPDPAGERTRTALAAINPTGSDDGIARAIAIIADDSALDEPLTDRQTDLHTMLATTLSTPDLATIDATLFGETPSSDKAARFAAVLTPLLAHLRRAASESFVKQRIAAAFKVETAISDVLLTRAVRSPRTPLDPSRMAIDELLDDGFVFGPPPTPGAPTIGIVTRTLEKLAKAALVVTRMHLGVDDLTFATSDGGGPWLIARAPSLGLLDLNAFPLEPLDSSATLYASWQRLRALIEIRDRSSAPGVDLWRLLAKADASPPGAETDFYALLATLVGATAEDLRALSDGLGLTYPTDFRDGSAIVRLDACLTAMRAIGASPKQMLRWAQADALTLADSADIKSAVKGNYETDTWLALAKPLRDVLRERQRDALADYLVFTRGLADRNALFAQFLIDVEMSACQLTSRMKQAIGSVQLFVQRMLVGLEPIDLTPPRVTLDAARAQWWTWMKSYRVWQANREVFLYPENWIEPELRDDKTPFFKQLEAKLLQADVTNDAAETVIGEYLESLDAVSRAQVVGLYHDEDEDELHVIARTRGTPRIHYRRTRTQNGTWTAWERIDLDISSEWVLPTVWNRRLHLFWALGTEVPDPSRTETTNDTGEPPATMMRWRLAYSEFQRGKWSSKRETTSSFTFNVTEAPSYSFELYKEPSPTGGEDLVVQCYAWDPLAPILDWDAPLLAVQQFRFFGCGGDAGIEAVSPLGMVARPPQRIVPDYMSLAESPNSDASDTLFLSTVGRANAEVLRSTPGLFRLTFSRQQPEFVVDPACFMEDQRRSFFVRAVPRAIDWTKSDAVAPLFTTGAIPWSVSEVKGSATSAAAASSAPRDVGLAFETFYHPFIHDFIERLNRFGVDGLLRWQTQIDASLVPAQLLATKADSFQSTYAPQSIVVKPYPIEDVDFGRGAFAQYNWELFFHVPLLIAQRLSSNQRFEDALRWFHFIFDPTDVSKTPAPAKYWKVRKFYDDARMEGIPKTIDELLALLGSGGGSADVASVIAQINEWRDHPFSPHAIARLRTSAYQKTVVMKYLDNLIAWGDQLFRRNTLESTNEAALLYILAADILGPRPTRITPPAKPEEPQTYRSLIAAGLDTFSNALVAIENVLAPTDGVYASSSDAVETLSGVMSLPYFCAPANDILLSYWDTIADRLFKLRHCMNIEGQVQQLPLFEPPIDPGLLVRAAAAGVDLSSAVNDIGAPPPLYRFDFMLQRALDLAGDVRSLGGSILSALEKKDAEAFAILRAGQEVDVLTAARDVRQMQIDEAQNTLDALQKSQELATLRRDYYTNIPFLIPSEQEHLDKLKEAYVLQLTQQGLEVASGLASGTPTVTTGGAGYSSPVMVTTVGGTITGAVLSAAARAVGVLASALTYEAGRAATMGEHQRRANDWALQARLASKEIEQIGKQIIAAQIRLAIAQRELDNHDRLIDNAKAVSDYLSNKFTSADLYDWMIGELAGVYFQTYQLAFDVARRAERAYRFERQTTELPYVQFGYWDSLKKGLLAGERLHFDLRRMQAAYVAQNRRELEITKHVSLALHDPAALIVLQHTGSCFVYLYDEATFDADYPGHYLRRIKNVSLTIPCVVGPYQSINCTLTLVKHRLRPSSDPGGALVETLGAIDSIVTSSAQADSGLFEASLRDERYLPFEGAGAMSIFRIELPSDTNAFDRSTLTDVVLHLRYTARDGGEPLRSAARDAMGLARSASPTPPPKSAAPRMRMFRARTDFPDAWARFVATSSGDHVLELDFSDQRFPFHSSASTLSIKSMRVVLDLAQMDPPLDLTGHFRIRVQMPDGSYEPAIASSARDVAKAPELGNVFVATFGGGEVGGWSLTVAAADLPPQLRAETSPSDPAAIDEDRLRDVLLLCELEIS